MIAVDFIGIASSVVCDALYPGAGEPIPAPARTTCPREMTYEAEA
jgi:hypothetical protein